MLPAQYTIHIIYYVTYATTVPYIQSPLPDGVLHDLQETVHPLDQSSNHDIDLYMSALQFVSCRL